MKHWARLFRRVRKTDIKIDLVELLVGHAHFNQELIPARIIVKVAE